MLNFLSDHHIVLFALVKIGVMLGVFMNLAPVLVFVERRQAALIQDRVGPNRAVINVPGFLLKGALATPPLLLGLAVAGVCYKLLPANPPETGVGRGFWLAQAGVFVLWSHLLLLAGAVRIGPVPSTDPANPLEEFLVKMKDPRWIFYTGATLHVLLAVAYAGLKPENAGDVSKALAFGGPAVFAGACLLVGAYMGYRIPNGPVGIRAAGLFHSIADAVKFAFKEDFIPPNADKLLHGLAPIISVFPALVTYAIIPFGDNLCFKAKDGKIDLAQLSDVVSANGACGAGEVPVSLQVADLNVGILYLFAVAGTGIVGAAIAGWSSDNKWSLLGGLRAASQMVSYEVAMGLSLAGAFMMYGTPRLGDMVRWQQQNAWGIFVQPLAFFMFFAAAIAEQKRTPFDAPEGESEIIAGYFVEYSSFKFAMFYTGEYIEVVTSSALLVTIFLGGWTVPFLYPDGLRVAFGDTTVFTSPMSHLTVSILGVLIFFGKTILLSFFQIFIRWTLPRFRYDQIMSFGWKFLLPLSIGNLVVTGLLILLVDSAGDNVKSGLKLVADGSHAVVLVAMTYVVARFVLLLLSPVERTRFLESTTAARTARLGRTPESAMQALQETTMGNGIVGKPIPRPKRDAKTQMFLPSVIAGLGVTVKHFFKNTKEMALGQRNDPVLEAFDEGVTTISYPEQKRPYPERFRGVHRLTLREDGSPRCVACLCCSTACPAQCIFIEAGEYPSEKKGWEKYPVRFVIDELRCIFCGYCVEACPCDAIRMDTGQHAVPYDSRDQFIYDRETLMGFTDTRGKQETENPKVEPAGGHTPDRLGHH